MRVLPNPAESLDGFFACTKQEEVNANTLLDEAEGDYLSASFVKRRRVTTVRIVDEGEMLDIVDKKTGKTIQKPCFGIAYAGQRSTDPFKWTMNNKTRNALLDLFGHETSQWVNQNVEITLAGEGEYQHVTLDAVRTVFVPGGAPPLPPAAPQQAQPQVQQVQGQQVQGQAPPPQQQPQVQPAPQVPQQAPQQAQQAQQTQPPQPQPQQQAQA